MKENKKSSASAEKEASRKLLNIRPQAAVFPDKRRHSGAPIAGEYQVKEAKEWVDQHKM